MNSNNDLFIVREEAIRSAAALFGEADNNFTPIIKKVDIFREAEMTPVILMDKDYTIYVVAAETYMKKLH